MAEETNSHIQAEISPNFIPWGALAFLLTLVALCLILWFSVYFMMIGRA